MSQGPEESKIRDHIHQMLGDRQYTNIHDLDAETIAFTNHLHMSGRVWVASNCPILKIAQWRTYYESCKEVNVYHLIIITQNGVAPFTHREIFQTQGILVELFTLFNFQILPINHYLVPKHKKTTQLDMDKNHLPKLSINDPVVRYYGFQLNDVIEIDRIVPFGIGLMKVFRVVDQCNILPKHMVCHNSLQSPLIH